MAFGNLSQFRTETLVHKRMTHFLGHLVNSDEKKLSKSMFRLLKDMCDKDVFKSSWVSKVVRNSE